LKCQIKTLKKELKEMNDKNKELMEENINLKNEIEKTKFLNFQKETDDNFHSDKKILELYNRIDELKKKLSRYPYDLSDGEKLISAIITSLDQKINFSFICKNTTPFIIIEEKLYKHYPNYSELQNFFIVNGNRVNKYKTFEENKIKDNDNIVLYNVEL